MMRRTVVLAVVLLLGSGAFAAYGMVTHLGMGLWPDTWPKELEPYRDDAITLGVHTGLEEIVYAIPFSNRDEFEPAWPCILEIRSPSAPIILERSPWNSGGDSMVAGVRILHPRVPPGGRHIRRPKIPPRPSVWGMNWPKDIQLQSGSLPEYAVQVKGKWVPWTGQKSMTKPHRARVDIVLVVDDNIVDPSRIKFPADAPIVDKRKNEEMGLEKPTN